MANPSAHKIDPRVAGEGSQRPEEQPLSPEARAALDAGIESARRGEIQPWGDFTKYVTDDDE